MQSNARRHRASFVKKMSANKGRRAGKRRAAPKRKVSVKTRTVGRRRSGKRLAAYNASYRKHGSKAKAARAAVRAVPFTQAERKRGAAFKGAKQRYRRNEGAPEFEATTTQAPSFSGRTKIGGFEAPKKKRRAGKRRAGKKRKGAKRKTAARRRPTQYAGRKGHKRRVRYGKYRRVKARQLGRKGTRLTYMYRGKKGRVRKIPAWAIAGAPSAKAYKDAKYDKARARISKRRSSASARLLKSGGAFVPNGKGTAARRRRRAFNHARAEGMNKHKAALAAVRSVPFNQRELAAGKSFEGIHAGAKTMARKKRRKSKKTGRRSAKRRTKRTKKVSGRRRKTGRRKVKRNGRRKAGRRKSVKRRTAAKRRSHKRRKSHGRRKVHANKRRSHRRRKVHANPHRRHRRRRHVKANRSRRVHANKRRHGRRRHARRNYRRNGFTADLKMLLGKGLLVLGGFFAHRVLTGLAVQYVAAPLMKNVAADSMLVTYQKPIVGGVVGLLGIGGLSMAKGMKADTKAALGAGIVVSWLQNLVMSVLTSMNQPTIANYLSGYENSTAYRLRGIGMERNARSTMPRYAPVNGLGQGGFRQAAAGMGRAAVGEYFASSNLQGVGHYEKAGPLAMQPTFSAMGDAPIDDGIRPDADLDHVLDLAESAAGLGTGYRQAAAGMGGPGYMQAAAGLGGRRRQRRGMRGMGEYFAPAAGLGEYYSDRAAGGGFSEFTVPTQDQWIPNGPLWAGDMNAAGSPADSEVPAGILQGPGGNGSLS